jgi:hypothetical protein
MTALRAAKAAARVALAPGCIAGCIVLAAAFAAGCTSRSTDYPTLADARAAGVFEQRLLPDVLPPSAALIRVERDDDAPSGFFHFSSSDYAPLAARLQPLPQMPADPALKVWIQRKDLAGYDVFSAADGGANWLLLCAQNKGRCYVRRM